MADVARVQQEFRRLCQPIDFVHGRLQGPNHVRIGWLVEAQVAVADLYEAEVYAVYMSIHALGEGTRHWNATAHRPHQSRTRPRHALQETAPVDAIVVELLPLLIDKVLLLVGHLPSLVGSVLR